MSGDGEAGMSGDFVKRVSGAPPDAYAAEAAGLRWLAAATDAGGAAVVAVRDVGPDRLVLARLTPVPSTADRAEAFGRALARTHAAGAASYGSPPAGREGSPADYLASLPLPYGEFAGFGPFYAQTRVRPYLRLAADRGDLAPTDVAVLERLCARLEAGDAEVCGPPEPPSRLHGDLWSGNVVWTADGGVLIDPAAHGGHRETDLAMLALFGAPHLDRILAAYDEAAPLAAGWRQRVPLHQVHPLLVHAVLFGGGYGTAAVAAARHFC